MVSNATYEPWGAPRSGSATLGGFGFTGEQTDAETGLVYLRARHYDPATGRFLTADSSLGVLEAPASLNLYTYVENNPSDWVDPSGHGKVRVVVRVLHEVYQHGKHHFVPGKQVSVKQAQYIRRNQGNVAVQGGTAKARHQTAQQIESGAYPNGEVVQHSPHQNSPTFQPHLQQKDPKVKGHTFYSVAGPVALGPVCDPSVSRTYQALDEASTILQYATGVYWTQDLPGPLKYTGDVIDFLNPIPVSDVKDALDWGKEMLWDRMWRK